MCINYTKKVDIIQKNDEQFGVGVKLDLQNAIQSNSCKLMS